MFIQIYIPPCAIPQPPFPAKRWSMSPAWARATPIRKSGYRGVDFAVLGFLPKLSHRPPGNLNYFWTKLLGSILSPKEPAFVLAGNPCQCGPTGPALGPEGGWGVAQEGNFVNKHPDFRSKMRGGFYRLCTYRQDGPGDNAAQKVRLTCL